mmetsp:Transcript_4705/g.7224  ORF Transcript_4705/g.7224 Transcript_4705/m.7224 type:complete len:133 (+) Transcript_4705:234-632(+)
MVQSYVTGTNDDLERIFQSDVNFWFCLVQLTFNGKDVGLVTKVECFCVGRNWYRCVEGLCIHMSSAQPPSSHNLPPNDVCAGCKRSGLNLLVCDDCVTSGVDVSGRGNTKQRCVGNCRWVDRGGLGFSLVDM